MTMRHRDQRHDRACPALQAAVLPAGMAAIRVPGLRCVECGSADLFAVSPGAEPQFAPLPLLGTPLDTGEPLRAWCCEHWPWRRMAAPVDAVAP